MITKEQLVDAICEFIDDDMLPKADGNYKILLNTAKVALRYKPDSILKFLKSNSFISMFDIIDDNDNIDMDLLVKILSEGFGSDEFSYVFNFFGKEYALHFSAADIQTIKRYV